MQDAAKAGDGTINNVGVKMTGTFQCPHCQQKYSDKKSLDLHYRINGGFVNLATFGFFGQISAKFLRDGTVQRVGLQWIADSAPFGTKSLQFSESATCPHRAPGTRDQGRSKRDRGPSTRQKNVV